MSLILEIPPELEDALKVAADQKGMSVADFALKILSENRVSAKDVKSGTELVAYWKSLGIIGMRDEIQDSVEHVQRLRESQMRRFDP